MRFSKNLHADSKHFSRVVALIYTFTSVPIGLYYPCHPYHLVLSNLNIVPSWWYVLIYISHTCNGHLDFLFYEEVSVQGFCQFLNWISPGFDPQWRAQLSQQNQVLYINSRVSLLVFVPSWLFVLNKLLCLYNYTKSGKCGQWSDKLPWKQWYFSQRYRTLWRDWWPSYDWENTPHFPGQI